MSDLLADQRGEERDGRERIPDVELENQRLELREAVAGLPASDRTILLLTLVDGHGVAAIAARLGLTAEIVRRRKADALGRVRNEVLARLSSGRRCP